jgi:ATP-dependent RNA helicase SUPV3L1/SUV3
MNMEPEPITTAGLFPPSGIVERFANYFPPNTPFSYILLRLHEMSDLHPRFHLCSLKDQLQIADAIHPVQNLTVQDRLLLCAAPTSLRGEGEKELLEALARCIADGESGDLLDLPIPLETLDEPPSPGRAYLYKLEQLHKMLILYLWLSYRFPHVLPSRALANYTKGLVEEAIEKALEQFSYSEQAHELIMKKRRKAMKSLETEDSIPKEPTASAAAPTSAPNAEVEVPPAVIDVLKDGASFKSEPPSDDEGQYPTPELEVEELDLNTEDNQTQQTHPNRA